MNTPSRTIPEEAKALLTDNGFDNRFYFFLRTEQTQEAAWQKVEEEHKEYFGRDRYSSFNSYRNSRNKRVKGQK